jgi:3-methyladenine DNA glycosylase AlkD
MPIRTRKTPNAVPLGARRPEGEEGRSQEPGPKPETIVRESKTVLESRADRERALRSRRYFKEKVEFLGVTTPEIRTIESDVWNRIRSRWKLEDAIAYAEAMLADRFHEVRALGLLVLLRFRKQFDPALFERTRKWLSADRLDNWALVDVFCPDALGPLLETRSDLEMKIKAWTKDPNRWVKRASAVSFIKIARRGRCLETVYDIAERLFPVEDDLIHKATGWLLREAGRTDRPRLRDFLLKHGPAIPRTALRYAIEHFPEAERRGLLTRTKPRSSDER